MMKRCGGSEALIAGALGYAGNGVVVAPGREAYWLRTGNKAVTKVFYKKGREAL